MSRLSRIARHLLGSMSPHDKAVLKKRVATKPKFVYRGAAIALTDREANFVKKLQQMPISDNEIGQHYKLGSFILDLLAKKHGGVGVHWSTREEMAETAANVSARRNNVIAFVLVARFDESVVDWETDDVSGFYSEDEIPLKEGSHITVTNIRLINGPAVVRRSVLKSPKTVTI